MKIHFLKLKSWLLVTLMGAMGLGGCHCHKKMAASEAEPEAEPTPEMRDRGEARLMYGVPTMNYMIRGQVKDANGKPVKDIRVNMLERGMEVEDGELQGDPERVKMWLEESAAVTDQEGRFEIKNSGIPQERVRLMVRDVDGTENGEHKDRLVEVPVQQNDINTEGAGGWFRGTFDKKLDIKLEDK